MKRRTSFFLSLAAIGGGILLSSAPAASAASLPAPELVVVASGSPPFAFVLAAVTTPAKVQTPALPRYRVVSGDSLWSIGVRYHRSWPALASYNRILNPDLIYVDQVLTIPPATYVGTVPLPAPAPSYTPPTHTTTYTAPTRQYAPVRSQPVVGSGGGAYTGVWACIAQHESGGQVNINTGNGYYGGLQFTEGTWLANGGTGNPANASAAEQQRVANNVVANSGGSYGAWPNTSRMC